MYIGEEVKCHLLLEQAGLVSDSVVLVCVAQDSVDDDTQGTKSLEVQIEESRCACLKLVDDHIDLCNGRVEEDATPRYNHR